MRRLGEPKPVTPPPEDLAVMAMVPAEFTEGECAYDADSHLYETSVNETIDIEFVDEAPAQSQEVEVELMTSGLDGILQTPTMPSTLPDVSEDVPGNPTNTTQTATISKVTNKKSANALENAILEILGSRNDIREIYKRESELKMKLLMKEHQQLIQIRDREHKQLMDQRDELHQIVCAHLGTLINDN